MARTLEMPKSLVLSEEFLSVHQCPAHVFEAIRRLLFSSDVIDCRFQLGIRRPAANSCTINLFDQVFVRKPFLQLTMESILFFDELLLKHGTVKEFDRLGKCRRFSTFTLARRSAAWSAKRIEKSLVEIRTGNLDGPRSRWQAWKLFVHLGHLADG